MHNVVRNSDRYSAPLSRQRVFRWASLLASAALITTLAACSSGDGGSNGHGDAGNAPGVVNPSHRCLST